MEEKVDPCSVRILFSCWSLRKKWVKICLSRLNYPILHCPQWKAIKFPMPPKGFPPQRDCPLKINNLAFLCWWQSQERAGGGFFFFMLIFFLFCIMLPSASPYRWFPYIAHSTQNLCTLIHLQSLDQLDLKGREWAHQQIESEHPLGIRSVLDPNRKPQKQMARFFLGRQNLSTWALLTFGSDDFLCGCCPKPCRMLSGIPGSPTHQIPLTQPPPPIE